MPEITLIAQAIIDGSMLALTVIGLYTLTHLAGLLLGFRRSPAEFVSDVWDRRARRRRTASRTVRRAGPSRSRT